MLAATQLDALRLKLSGTEVQHLHAAGTVDGVIVSAVAARNGPGTGRLQVSSKQGTNPRTARWRAPGSATYGDTVLISTDQEYVLTDGEDDQKWVRIDVRTSFLLEVDRTAEVFLHETWDNAVSHDDVTAAEATAGDVTTHTITVANDSGDTIINVTAWIDASVSGIEISDDGATWVTPTTEGGGLDLGSIVGNGSTTLYLRRTIGAGASSDPDILNLIHLSFDAAAPLAYDDGTPIVLDDGNLLYPDAADYDGYNHDGRGQYRIFNDAEYRFYRSNSAPPAESDTPFATASSLPDNPSDTFADGTWWISVSYFNGVIDSGFLPIGPAGETYRLLTISGGTAATNPPAAPLDVRLEVRAGGVIRIIALYFELPSLAVRADDWAIAYTTNGSTPAEDSPDVTQAMTGSPLQLLSYDLPAQSNGTTVKVRVQTVRDGPSYSDGSTVLTATADAAGPAAPPNADRWPGRLPEDF